MKKLKTKQIKVTDLVRGMKLLNIGIVENIIVYNGENNIVKVRLLFKKFISDREYILFSPDKVLVIEVKSDGGLNWE